MSGRATSCAHCRANAERRSLPCDLLARVVERPEGATWRNRGTTKARAASGRLSYEVLPSNGCSLLGDQRESTASLICMEGFGPV